MPEERRQFRILYRDFLRRIVDLDVLSSHGDIQKLLVQLAAMLAAFSSTFVLVFGTKYINGSDAHARIAIRADMEFLVATTMAVAGLFSVLAWNTVLPDRRDCLILGLLPVRNRTVFLAKAAALATALGVAVAALNIFTGFWFPFVGLPQDSFLAALHAFAGYWVAMAAAGLFICCGMLALQGLAAQLLPYRHFLRVSSFLQLAAFFAVLAAWFLRPPGAVPWMPSSWFFGLEQQLSGRVPSHPLAPRALRALFLVCGAAAISFALSYGRSIRKIVEQPDILPTGRPRHAPSLVYALLRRPLDRAIVLFTARTIARSRQHRLFLAAYAGIGLAVAFSYGRDLLYGVSEPWEQNLGTQWNQLNAPLLMGGLVLLCFAVVGARAIFSLPIELRANWVFWLTAVQPPAAYFRAVRKALFSLTVLPVWTADAAAYFLIWPLRPAALHMLVLSLAAILFVHVSLYQFRKIPFACSYLPGKSNMHVRLALYGGTLILVASFCVQIEYFTMPYPWRFAVFSGFLAFAAAWSVRHWSNFANSPYNWIQFEELPQADIEALDLHNTPTAPPSAPPPLEAGISIRPRPIYGLEPAAEPSAPEPLRAQFGQFFADLRSSVRIFRRAPGFSAAAVALMAVGIGGNTAIYSLINGILNRPAPGIRAENLVYIAATMPGDRGADVVPFPIYTDFLVDCRTIQSIAASAFQRFVMTAPNGTYELRGLAVTSNYFGALGVPIVKGRSFTGEETRGAAALAVVIAYHVWQNQFQSAPDILGRQVLLNGVPATIVGVAAQGFRGTHFAPNFEAAVPILGYARLHGEAQALARSGVELIGRLSPGVSLAQAQAEFDAISARVAAAYPELARQRIVLTRYSATAFGPWQSAQAKMFMALLTGVGLLTLLVVCANVANLMLGRSAARQREFAVRQSLGASRRRILSLLLSEGLALSLAAAAAAWAFAWWVARDVPALIPPLESGARIEPNVAPDWRVAIYALALAVFGALAFTLAPSLRAWRQELLPYLKAGGPGAIEGRSNMANVLAVVQLAFCVLLLGGAGLASRSVFLIDAADLGFPKDHRLILRLNTLGAGGAEDQRALLESLRARLAAVHNVTAVSYASAVPPDPFGQLEAVVGQTPIPGMVVGPRYLYALGVRVEGRDFIESDADRDVAILTRRAAESLFPGQSAVGRSIEIFGRPYEAIGVAANGAYSGLQQQGGDRFVFLSRTRGDRGGVQYFNIRYAGPFAPVAASAAAIIRDASATQRIVGSVQSMDAFMQQYTAPALVIGTLLSLFSAGSLIVAGIGLYAVIAFHAARRTREFGIRMALGATSRHVLRAVLKEGMVLTAAGSLIGLALSAATSRLLRGLLFGVSPIDPFAWAGVIALLGAVALTACYIPARRAGRIEPLEALRQE
jgi:predicted permease